MNKDLNNLIFIFNLFLEHQYRLKPKKVFHPLLLQASILRKFRLEGALVRLEDARSADLEFNYSPSEICILLFLYANNLDDFLLQIN